MAKGRFVVPWPDREVNPEVVVHSIESSWRGNDMTLLEFLRQKTYASGEIKQHLRRKHAEAVRQGDDFGFFCTFSYRMNGERVVSCHYEESKE